MEVTETLHNGDPLPTHPATTTSRKVEHVLEARDAVDGTVCRAGMPRNELAILMQGEPILDHLYLYCILNKRVYTTRRNGVILVVRCVDIDERPAETES